MNYIVAQGIFKKNLSSLCIIHKEKQHFSNGLISHYSSCYYIHTNEIFKTDTKMFLSIDRYRRNFRELKLNLGMT